MGSVSEQATLAVVGMSCAHCEATIEDALGALSGVHRVAADAAANLVLVEFDPSLVSLSRIEVILSEIGYPAEG